MKKMIMFGMIVKGIRITVRQFGERFVVEADGHGYYMSNGVIFTKERAMEVFRNEVEYHRGF